MAHHRETIRKAIATAVTGLTTTGDNVFPSRVDAYEDQALPALGVFGVSETVDEESIELGGHVGMRRYTVAVEGRARNANPVTLHDTLDDIAAEVEVAVMAAQDAGSLGVNLCTLTGTELELDAGAQQPTGLARLEFVCEYWLDAASPATAA